MPSSVLAYAAAFWLNVMLVTVTVVPLMASLSPVGTCDTT